MQVEWSRPNYAELRIAGVTPPLRPAMWGVRIVRQAVTAAPLTALVVSACIMSAASSTDLLGTANAADPTEPRMALPGEHCRIEPQKKWFKSEKRAWNRICKGESANFNLILGETLNRAILKDDSERLDDRKLTRGFLKVILSYEPYRSAIPPSGVRIVGANFPDGVDLTDVVCERPLSVRHSRFASSVEMHRLKTSSYVSFGSSRFEGELNMDSASIGGDLFMRDEAKFQDVRLAGAKIGDQLSMTGSTFNGTLNMDSISIGGHLFMRGGATFQDVNLRAAKIGDQLSMIGSTFNGTLDMDSASIGGSLFMTKASFLEPNSLVYVRVGSSLDISEANLSKLDLTGASVEGELRLGSSELPHIYWDRSEHAPMLTLRNTRVGFLQDTGESWPEHLKMEMEGFKYGHLGGLGMDEKKMASARGSEWFLEWLEKDDSYSPQPYQHLSTVLRAAGHDGMADDILFGSRARERRELSAWQLKWWGLGILEVVIGYGYGKGNFRAALWAAVFVVIGYVILRTEVNRKKKMDDEDLGFWYSIDMLLPVVHLRERHYERDLPGWPKWYFYVHRIVGYLLTFFVIAGLTGLTA